MKFAEGYRKNMAKYYDKQVTVTATFKRVARVNGKKTHVLITEATVNGKEVSDHNFIKRIDELKGIERGSKISFIATVKTYQKKAGFDFCFENISNVKILK